MMERVLLGGFHAIMGLILLGLGATALLRRKSRHAGHPQIGQIYFWFLTVTLGTGLVIGIIRQIRTGGGVTLFEIVTPPTWLAGLVGFVMAKRRPQGWLRWHIIGMSASFVGVITAFSFQTFPRFLPDLLPLTLAYWIVPTAVGSFLIRRTIIRWIERPAQVRAAHHGG